MSDNVRVRENIKSSSVYLRKVKDFMLSYGINFCSQQLGYSFSSGLVKKKTRLQKFDRYYLKTDGIRKMKISQSILQRIWLRHVKRVCKYNDICKNIHLCMLFQVVKQLDYLNVVPVFFQCNYDFLSLYSNKMKLNKSLICTYLLCRRLRD